MSFASRYLERNISFPPFIERPVSPKLGIVVVIPVFNEPALVDTVNSLATCTPPLQDVAVFAVVNRSETSVAEIEQQNCLSIKELETWKKQHPEVFFQLGLIAPPPFRKKHAGPGLARKAGMDEAIRHFAAIGRHDGVIVSLDADTLVDKNYFTEIEKHFFHHKKQVGATLRFQHRLEEIEEEWQRQGATFYEKYLHYYKNAMAFTGFPNAIYTIGSAFAVRADAYIKQGGMNRRQAGEDFYFLHKLTQLGEIGEINTTCVYPSARVSTRVPFGTGAAIQKWVQGDESLRLTYNFQSFCDLKQLFLSLPELYKSDLQSIIGQLPASVISFLNEEQFETEFTKIRANVSSFDNFRKRFFLWFNAFKILKFLNFVHPAFYSFQDLEEASRELSM